MENCICSQKIYRSFCATIIVLSLSACSDGVSVNDVETNTATLSDPTTSGPGTPVPIITTEITPAPTTSSPNAPAPIITTDITPAPTTSTSSTPEPITDTPGAPEPTPSEPSAPELTPSAPTSPEPIANEASAPEPVAIEPSAPGPIANESSAPEPAAIEPSAPEPPVNEPSASEPVANEPSAPEFAAIEPSAPEPIANEPSAPEPTTAQPAPPPLINISREEAVRFLVQSSFGPTEKDISDVQSLKYDGWIAEQMTIRPVFWLDRLEGIRERDSDDNAFRWHLPGLFWEGAIEGNDQLRQRVAWALTQIIANNVVSEVNHARPELFAYYFDIFQRHAFGNYEDILYEVSLSPSMGLFLTHINNEKENLETGTVPDENYAREIMQLFTIGLVNLNSGGVPIGGDTYTTEDVKGLAKVFTGLGFSNNSFGRSSPRDVDSSRSPMVGYPDFHEFTPKRFLTANISDTNSAEESVAEAISYLVKHRNTAPFISKQFIQKLVTANPTPAYVRRVSAAFTTGRFETPAGDVVGTGRHGDMAAMITAILLDENARNATRATNTATFGKAREPVLRQSQWARSFKDNQGRNLNEDPPILLQQAINDTGQTPLHARSVFSFFRPGFVLPDSQTAEAGLVSPEMQILTGSTVFGYLQTMSNLIVATQLEAQNLSFFEPDYRAPLALANDAEQLADYLNSYMVYGTLTDEVRTRVINGINATSIQGLSGEERQNALRNRVETALMILIASPEFNSQR